MLIKKNEEAQSNTNSNRSNFLQESKRFFYAVGRTAKVGIKSLFKLGNISAEEVNETLSDLKHFTDKFDNLFTKHITKNSPSHIKSFAPGFTYSLLAGSPSVGLIIDGTKDVSESNDFTKLALGISLLMAYTCTTLKKSTSSMGFDVITEKVIENSKKDLDEAICKLSSAIKNISSNVEKNGDYDKKAYNIIMLMPIIKTKNSNIKNIKNF